ncbi:hypothetical protein KKF59_04660 [Patescibacteria group bacterium]|nr:hypothetical protein [Patescibacteria group bacterium]MBU1034722.1 hypothetical protein [Patescibacteria group bacterium]MBU1630025.1 hypothetical protein [Patescibacteria group bacterium]MBU1908385.1 hypothetical protein [Patescibacteria group bacterium]
MALQSAVLINIHTGNNGLLAKAIEKIGLLEAVWTKPSGNGAGIRPKAKPGVQIFGGDGIKNVEASALVEALLAQGYVPVQAYWRKNPLRDEGRIIPPYADRHLIRAIFSREPKDQVLNSRFCKVLIAFLEGKVFRYCHGYRNERSDDVNLTGGVDPMCGSYKSLKIDERGVYSFRVIRAADVHATT